MLPFSEWLSEAERLPEGREDRINHLCGDGKVLVIGHTSEGYRAWCHRCHIGGFKPHGRRSLEEHLKRLQEADNAIEIYSVQLPRELSDTFSRSAILWLSKGGITSTLRERYGIRFHPATGRVILPVYDVNSNLVYYQARAVEKGQQPKYLNPKVDRDKIRFVTRGYSTEEILVVTEDILSAIRVGDIQGFAGCSLLGTRASAADINFLNRFKRIILWFDPDEAGRKCTDAVRRSLGLLGRSVYVMSSDKDPKLYTKLELESMLYEQLRCDNAPNPTG